MHATHPGGAIPMECEDDEVGESHLRVQGGKDALDLSVCHVAERHIHRHM